MDLDLQKIAQDVVKQVLPGVLEATMKQATPQMIIEAIQSLDADDRRDVIKGLIEGP